MLLRSFARQRQALANLQIKLQAPEKYQISISPFSPRLRGAGKLQIHQPRRPRDSFFAEEASKSQAR
jgi:hypothetical protein